MSDLNFEVNSREDFLVISLDEAKEYLRLSENNPYEDTLLEALIKASTDNLEKLTWQSILEREIRLLLPTLEKTTKLYSSPISAVESINILQSNGTYQVLSTDNYEVNLGMCPGQINLKSSAVIPSLQISSRAVRIDYKAGYANANLVPENIKVGVKLLMAHIFENRDLVSPVELKSIPATIRYFIESLKRTYLV